MKNEPLMELAKLMELANKFMNECNNFEIRNLDAEKGHSDDLPF